MIAEASVLRARRRGNLVILGSDQPLPAAALPGRRPATRFRPGSWSDRGPGARSSSGAPCNHGRHCGR
jgi:hypothetical protein